jgi:hypothetical protein
LNGAQTEKGNQQEQHNEADVFLGRRRALSLDGWPEDRPNAEHRQCQNEAR